MSDAEQDTEEPPEIDDDERADIDLDDISDEIEGADEADDEPASDDAETATETADETDALPDRTSIGDVYCNGLGVGASVVVARYDDVGDRESVADEYAGLAREIGIDDWMNEWVREQGRPEELPPGQAVVVGTVMFAAAVMVSNPSVGEGLMEELQT